VAIIIKDFYGVIAVSESFSITTSWERYSVTGTFDATAADGVIVFIDPVDDTGAPGDTFYAWGAQLEEASSMGDYVKTTGQKNVSLGIASEAMTAGKALFYINYMVSE